MRIEEDIKKVLDDHEEVLVAYLYGSLAKGTARKESDIDIGLLLEEDYEPDGLYSSRVSGEVEGELESGRDVDVRVLNERPITFQHQVLKNGDKIFTRDEKARIDFETKVYDRFLDYKPFFDRYNEIRRKRILA